MSDIYEDCYEVIRDTIDSWVIDEFDWYYEADPPFEHSLESMRDIIRDIVSHVG